MADSRTFLPGFLAPLLAGQYGEAISREILDGLGTRRKTTLRANRLLSNRSEIANALDAAGIDWSPVGWYDDAFVLAPGTEDELRALPIYQEGKIYLQSLSSMIPALILDAHPGEDVCDLCAAPGGKTTQIAALTGGASYITACEMHAPRADKLEHNLNKLGARNVTVMRTDARRLDEFFSFDRILVDAPCSGSGTLRAGDPQIARRFTETLIAKSVKAQRALLVKGLSLLKPGGTLVYSTCSVLARENEEVVSWALGQTRQSGRYKLVAAEVEHGDEMPTLPTVLEGALCLRPTELYEGFFMTKIVREQ